MNKTKSLLIILAIYIFAFFIGYIPFYFVNMSTNDLILSLFVFDVTATIVVYLFGVILSNSSVYDPYWSVAPIVILIIVYFNKGFTYSSLMLFIPILIWGIRLTINWAITFKNLSTQDWRYQMYQENYPKLWPIINFFGINMMPTVLVFVALIPGIVFLGQPAGNAFSLIGGAVILFGTLLEVFADRHMHRFLKKDHKKWVCKEGLWKYSRHPNYLGEITVWFGVYFTLIISFPSLWFLFSGALLILCLFVFISIPLMEKRQVKRRPEYSLYQKTTSALLILPNRKNGFNEQTQYQENIP